MQNKLGFSLIEIMIGIAIIIGVVISSVSLNTNNDLDETTLSIMSKLEYTQKLGQNAPASGYYKVNGEDSLPFVIFREKSMIFLSAKDTPETLIENTEKYSSNGTEVKVSTNLEDGDFIFSSQGFVYDKNGRPVGNAHVYVTKGNTTKTISIDCSGRISKSTGKNTSAIEVCKSTNTEEEYKFPESSIVKCDDKTEDMWDGKCLKKCGDHATRNASGTCMCDNGYELHNNVCSYVYKPKQCGANETLVGYNKWSSSGACNCISGYEQNNGTCSYVYKPKQCGTNETVTGYNKWSSSGTCTCSSGYETFNGKCVAVCSTGQTRQDDGSCVKVPEIEGEGVFIFGTGIPVAGGLQVTSVGVMKNDNEILYSGDYSTAVNGDIIKNNYDRCAKKIFDGFHQPTGLMSYMQTCVHFQGCTSAGGIIFYFSKDKTSFSHFSVKELRWVTEQSLTGIINQWTLSKWYSELHTCGAF